jgi:hypothetical protein
MDFPVLLKDKVDRETRLGASGWHVEGASETLKEFRADRMSGPMNPAQG